MEVLYSWLKAPELVTLAVGHMAMLVRNLQSMMRTKSGSVESADSCLKMRPKNQKFGLRVAFVASGFTFLAKVFHLPPPPT